MATLQHAQPDGDWAARRLRASPPRRARHCRTTRLLHLPDDVLLRVHDHLVADDHLRDVSLRRACSALALATSCYRLFRLFRRRSFPHVALLDAVYPAPPLAPCHNPDYLTVPNLCRLLRSSPNLRVVVLPPLTSHAADRIFHALSSLRALESLSFSDRAVFHRPDAHNNGPQPRSSFPRFAHPPKRVSVIAPHYKLLQILQLWRPSHLELFDIPDNIVERIPNLLRHIAPTLVHLTLSFACSHTDYHTLYLFFKPASLFLPDMFPRLTSVHFYVPSIYATDQPSRDFPPLEMPFKWLPPQLVSANAMACAIRHPLSDPHYQPPLSLAHLAVPFVSVLYNIDRFHEATALQIIHPSHAHQFNHVDSWPLLPLFPKIKTIHAACLIRHYRHFNDVASFLTRALKELPCQRLLISHSFIAHVKDTVVERVLSLAGKVDTLLIVPETLTHATTTPDDLRTIQHIPNMFVRALPNFLNLLAGWQTTCVWMHALEPGPSIPVQPALSAVRRFQDETGVCLATVESQLQSWQVSVERE